MTKGSLPPKTTADVRALVAREQAVLSDLASFEHMGPGAAVAAWEARLKGAESAQGAAMTALNADLGSHVPPPRGAAPAGPHVIFSVSGSGISSTRPFTIPATDKAWQINWSYNCSGYGSEGNFDYSVNQGTAPDFNDFGPNQLGAQGHGVEHYYDQGTFNLQVNSECSWSIQVIG